MTKYNVTVIVGSLRKESYNLRLAKALQRLGKEHFEVTFAEIGDLPLFSQDLEPNFPAHATRLKNEIKNADGILIVTPEYNRSIPAPLKNAIDWASRPYGQNAFAGKPVALCGTSPGTIGTACAQQHLKPVLGYLDTRLLSQEIYFQFKEGIIDIDGNIADDNTRKFLQSFVNNFADWIGKHK